jgi:hypothetical protein
MRRSAAGHAGAVGVDEMKPAASVGRQERELLLRLRRQMWPWKSSTTAVGRWGVAAGTWTRIGATGRRGSGSRPRRAAGSTCRCRWRRRLRQRRAPAASSRRRRRLPDCPGPTLRSVKRRGGASQSHSQCERGPRCC